MEPTTIIHKDIVVVNSKVKYTKGFFRWSSKHHTSEDKIKHHRYWYHIVWKKHYIEHCVFKVAYGQ